MQTLGEAARAVLLTPDPHDKRRAARAFARAWRRGELEHRCDVAMPDQPAWPPKPELLSPGQMPRRRKAGSDRGRIAMIHALAHIEFVAIDLAVDLVGRFGGEFPRAFVDDWIGVAADEAMHFALLDRRLRQLDSFYGELPAHAGLWEAAQATSDDALARLAIVPMVLEARGLDVTPATIDRFRAAGDEATAKILSRIYNDEIRHVSAGTVWFREKCDEMGFNVVETWQSLVKSRFRGSLKPPFNDSARREAGLTQDFYAVIAW
ncbi:ferritin-like domain-containing protein [Sphingopyxis sp. BSN-002]|uniref:ferritin-like domain-containing protein n=1 Tax=Sphingopyxis sp. BSN-002 TaxID=2911495 RepID=UPI001EDA6E37|nr:ferritin-like domain-containing protein [Sphingopyxis sp. BSN-002]UKK85880.1 ferritin-like domain-containing protein [Sphingopyxis sp. BSN-002]